MRSVVVVKAVRGEPLASGAAAGQAPVAAMLDRVDSTPAFRHAGGVEDWVVACVCGTRDDDGERMMLCDGENEVMGCKGWREVGACACAHPHTPGNNAFPRLRLLDPHSLPGRGRRRATTR